MADLAAIDLPGFGRSLQRSSSPESSSLDRLAEQVIWAANALDWREPLLLIGHSHGGGVAQVVAARYPDRVRALVLIASLGAPAHANYRLLSLPGAAAFARIAGWLFRAKGLRAPSRAILKRVLNDVYSPEPVPTEKLERELALFASRPEILRSMVHVTLGRPCARLLRAASEIRCPTLFLHGQDDALVPARYARAIHDRILDAGGRSRFELVPEAGHMLIDFQAAELAQLILRSTMELMAERA
jgi:pimeloyl-ACP methyl ester carboxylesterase